MVALRSQGNWRWEGPLGTPLGLGSSSSSFYVTIVLSLPLLCFLVQIICVSNADPNVMALKITRIRLDEWLYQPGYHNLLFKAVLQVISY